MSRTKYISNICKYNPFQKSRYFTNITGPSTGPCGTPQMMSEHFDSLSSNCTNWCLLYYFVNQFHPLPPIPHLSILSSSILWLILSEALFKLINTPTYYFFLSCDVNTALRWRVTLYVNQGCVMWPSQIISILKFFWLKPFTLPGFSWVDVSVRSDLLFIRKANIWKIQLKQSIKLFRQCILTNEIKVEP